MMMKSPALHHHDVWQSVSCSTRANLALPIRHCRPPAVPGTESDVPVGPGQDMAQRRTFKVAQWPSGTCRTMQTKSKFQGPKLVKSADGPPLHVLHMGLPLDSPNDEVISTSGCNALLAWHEQLHRLRRSRAPMISRLQEH